MLATVERFDRGPRLVRVRTAAQLVRTARCDVVARSLGMSNPNGKQLTGRDRPLQLALRPDEAAEALSVGRSFFYTQVLPELRVIRRGRLRLIPITELERWLERNAARALQ